MLYMVIVTHSPESCPSREENAAIHPCLNSMADLLAAKEVIVGRWADPTVHVNYSKGCGMGYAGALSIQTIRDDGIAVPVRYSWPDIDCKRGELEATSVAQVGKRQFFRLSPVVSVTTYFSTPRRTERLN